MSQLILGYFLLSLVCFVFGGIQRLTEDNRKFWAFLQISSIFWPLWGLYGIYKLTHWIVSGLLTDLKE